MRQKAIEDRNSLYSSQKKIIYICERRIVINNNRKYKNPF